MLLYVFGGMVVTFELHFGKHCMDFIMANLVQQNGFFTPAAFA